MAAQSVGVCLYIRATAVANSSILHHTSFIQDFPDKSPPALRPSPDGRGTLKVSIYPKVSGSISDAQVQAEPEKYGGAQVATEDMLTQIGRAHV